MSRIVYTARVVSTKDPDSLGRVQVALDGFETAIELPWIRLVGPYASKEFGAFFLPEVDDEVILLQGDGDSLDQLLCLGSVYNGKHKPKTPDDDGKNNIKEIRTRSGHAITLDDTDGEEKLSIHTPDKKLILEFDHKEGTITLTSDKKVIVDVSDGEISVKCKDAKLNASGKITVKGDGDIKVEGSASIEVKASSSLKVESSAQVTVKGATVKVEGSMVELG